jgi:hypothetical protein
LAAPYATENIAHRQKGLGDVQATTFSGLQKQSKRTCSKKEGKLTHPDDTVRQDRPSSLEI